MSVCSIYSFFSWTFEQVFSRRSLAEPLQNLPRTLPSLHSSPTAPILIVGASFLDQPLQDLEVTTLGCSTGHSIIPSTALTPHIAQDLQVTITSSVKKNILVPRAGRVLSLHPLEHLKVTAKSSTTTRHFPPRTALRPQPLDHFQVAAKSSPTTSILVPQLTELFLWSLAPVLLKHLEVAAPSRDVENSLDDFRMGVVLNELPAPVCAPVLRKVVRIGITIFIFPCRSRHELPAHQHLRLSQLLGHQSKGAHVVLIKLLCNDRPHLRRKLDLSLVGALPPSLRGMADHVARSLALRRLVSVALSQPRGRHLVASPPRNARAPSRTVFVSIVIDRPRQNEKMKSQT